MPDFKGKNIEREIRRNQNYLVILGTGVLAFAVWTVVRTLAQYFLQQAEIKAMVEVEAAAPPEIVNAAMTVMLILILALLVIELILRLIVGFSARAEGKGKKKRKGYLVVAVFLIVLQAFSIGITLAGIFTDPGVIVEGIIGILIEITSAITIIQLIMASVRLRKLTAQKGQ